MHDKEYDILLSIATELQIDKPTFLDLFRKRDEIKVIKEEFSRILQFYRLALLMYIDGVLHQKELIAINEIGIKMGLNPNAMQRILSLMEAAPDRLVKPETIIAAFQVQHN